MRIMIVDDHVLFRQGLASLLHSEPDFEVVGQASSIREAIQCARELRPELILMDFMLPDGSGPQAAREILLNDPECLIVFLTVHADDERLFDALRSGGVGYLLKDSPINDLLASLRSVSEGEAALSRCMTRRVLEEFAFTGSANREHDDVIASLSQREKEVLRDIMTGASNREIAAHYVISENTVKHHIRSLFEKLEVSNRRQAAEYARRHSFK
jgi:two-component system nitrate/nitrite response regulator NarL